MVDYLFSRSQGRFPFRRRKSLTLSATAAATLVYIYIEREYLTFNCSQVASCKLQVASCKLKVDREVFALSSSRD